MVPRGWSNKDNKSDYPFPYVVEVDWLINGWISALQEEKWID